MASPNTEPHPDREARSVTEATRATVMSEFNFPGTFARRSVRVTSQGHQTVIEDVAFEVEIDLESVWKSIEACSSTLDDG